MVFVEVTADVAKHKTAKDYPCVRIHFFAADTHFHVKNLETPQGISLYNWVPKDDNELLEIIEKRWQVVEIRDKLGDPKALDFLYGLYEVARKHGWELRRR